MKFNPANTELYAKGAVKGPAPSTYDIRVVAIARLILLNRLKVGAYWLSVGKKLASTLLLAGANDLVGTMYNEAVLTSAGARHSATLQELAAIAKEAGKRPALRDTFHKRITPCLNSTTFQRHPASGIYINAAPASLRRGSPVVVTNFYS